MRVTVISPHPDDETLGCGGTLLKHKESGDQLDWIIVTRAHSPQWDAALLERKEGEIAAVAAAYGFDQVVRLGFPTMQLLQGRVDDFIVLPSGRHFSPRMVNPAFENLPGIIGTAEKGPVDAPGAALHQRCGNPYEHNPENRAQRHAEV